MALQVTGDNIRVDINKDGVNDNFFSVKTGASTCGGATEVFRVEDQGDVVLYGKLGRTSNPVTFDRLGSSGTIVEFGTVSGTPASFTKVGAIDPNGQAKFDDNSVLPADSTNSAGGTAGDVRLRDAAALSPRYAVEIKCGVNWVSIPLT